MATVIVQAVASLDGFIAQPDDLPGAIFDWWEAGEVEIAPGTPNDRSACPARRPTTSRTPGRPRASS